mmetsp:Transcript_5605/g.18977  ORF Transcript_5605/g.18977 Transcript_5605/m.18977 type:complete len:307 (-) Transcript_5605:70-990(-)
MGAVLHGVQHLLAPRQDGQRVNVRVHRAVVVVELVGGGVVGVVLALPPAHAEALHEVAPEVPHVVVVLAVLENLMVKEVVREPPTLLPEEAHDEGRGRHRAPRVAAPDDREGQAQDHELDDALHGVVRLVALEQPLGDHVRAQLAEVRHDARQLGVLLAELPNLHRLQQGPGGSRMEHGEHLSGILARPGVDNIATGVRGRELGHIVDLAPDDDPRVVLCVVLGHLCQRDVSAPLLYLGPLLGGRGLLLAQAARRGRLARAAPLRRHRGVLHTLGVPGDDVLERLQLGPPDTHGVLAALPHGGGRR